MKISRSNLTQQIIHVMQKFPRTRDNDRTLMTVFFQTYFPHEFNAGHMKPDALERMTNPDDIVRIRAHVQNDLNLFLATKPEIRDKRHQSEARWKNWLQISKDKELLQNLIRNA